MFVVLLNVERTCGACKDNRKHLDWDPNFLTSFLPNLSLYTLPYSPGGVVDERLRLVPGEVVRLELFTGGDPRPGLL